MARWLLEIYYIPRGHGKQHYSHLCTDLLEVGPLYQQRKDYFYEFMSGSKHRFFKRQAFCLPFQKIVSKDLIVLHHVNRH
jgi:hypothetical protein